MSKTLLCQRDKKIDEKNYSETPVRRTDDNSFAPSESETFLLQKLSKSKMIIIIIIN